MKKNVFVKPNEQSQACLNYAMARKGRMKSKYVIPESELITVRIDQLLETASGDVELDDGGEGGAGGALGKENIWDSEEDMDGLWN